MSKQIKYSYFILGLAFLAYIIARAILVGITYDEAWTIDGFVNQPVMDIINYATPIANNHMINTLAIKVLYHFGPKSVFVARLPNVIAAALYLFFVYKISKQFFKPYYGLALFILLLFNPFLLDFFSLARGYGLASASIIGSIYYFIKFTEHHQLKYANLSLIFGSISIINSFSILFYLPGLLFVIYYSFYLNKSSKAQFFQLTIGASITLYLLFSIIYEPLIKLISTNQLWYGGDVNFYEDTLHSLFSYSLGNKFEPIIITVLLNCFLTLFVLVMIFSFMKRNNKEHIWSSKKLKLLMLLVIPILATIVCHLLFGTKYLIDRTALFFYPLIIVALIQLAQDTTINYLRQFVGVSITIITISSMANMVNYLNFYTTTSWFQDAHTREIMVQLNELGKRNNKVIGLDAEWPFRASICYYEQRNHYPFVAFVEDEPNDLDSSKADYFLYLDKSLGNVGYYPENNAIAHFERDTMVYFEKEGVLLLSNKKK